MMDSVLNLLFCCRHRRITRPMTPVHRPGTPAGETYVACLECGKQFPYDVMNMRIGTPATASVGTVAPATANSEDLPRHCATTL
jgi:hypothetical protein